MDLITLNQLTTLGLDPKEGQKLLEELKEPLQSHHTPQQIWQHVSQRLLHSYPFPIHLLLFTSLFPTWHEDPETAPASIPSLELIPKTNISQWMTELNIADIKRFHQWTVDHYEDFWQQVIEKLKIRFSIKPTKIVDLSHGIPSPVWFPSAKLNIVDSCFTASSSAPALIYEDHQKKISQMSYEALNHLSNRIANSLIKQGFVSGDAIGIAMPMTIYAVAIYLGIIKIGGVVVSIADSFSSKEMATRLQIANAKAVFTQDNILWSGKTLPLYEKVRDANAPKIIVLPSKTDVSFPIRTEDTTWSDFLIDDSTPVSVPCDPMAPCNILFSSGTTADPKAIAWNHTTAIKAASDAYFHHNIQPNDVLAWPTNLGWMMGPWLIYAALINQATIALYPDAPKDRTFGEFIQRAQVTMLGVVPTLVASWRQSHCMENLDWRAIKIFSSTGECSNPEDMLYLMSLAGYKPVIEYCGGTEIGGSYITSTVIENNYPSLFTTPAMGLNFTLLNEEGEATNIGEVAIIPPSIGLSTQLLNADHDKVYFTGMPKTKDGKILRRHGDQVKQFPNGCYSVLGRVDDTMNLGGIKISAAEIERVIAGLPHIIETAAIAISPPNNGPSQLVIYASTQKSLEIENIRKEMQKRINSQLNPLFKIHDVVLMSELPKTASNKIMRRILRNEYNSKQRNLP